MTEGRDELVQHWMDRGRETLTEADLMADAGHWNACVNRLYYACFYAVTALLCQRGLSSSKHSGVRSLFNRHFVKPGLVPADLGGLYNTFFRSRYEGDYVDFVRFEESQVRPWMSQARQFVERIDELLRSSGMQTPDD